MLTSTSATLSKEMRGERTTQIQNALFKLDLTTLKACQLSLADLTDRTFHNAATNSPFELIRILTRTKGAANHQAVCDYIFSIICNEFQTGAKVDVTGRTLLHFAILCHQSIETITPLITSNVINIRAPSARNGDHGSTPLHYANSFERADVAKLLIEKGAAVDRLDQLRVHLRANDLSAAKKFNLSFDDLFQYVYSDRVEQSFMLLNYIRVIKDQNIFDYVYKLACNELEKPSNAFLSKLINDEIRADRLGQTLLHWAIFCNQSDAEITRVAKARTKKVISYDIEGQTPLHLATRSKNELATSIILKAEALKYFIAYAEYFACRLQPRKLREFISRYTEIYFSSNSAVSSLLQELFQHPTRYKSIVKRLSSIAPNSDFVKELNFGIKLVNAKDNKNRTPLSWAMNFGNLTIADQLLHLGANINEPQADGLTYLHLACATPFTTIKEKIRLVEKRLLKEKSSSELIEEKSRLLKERQTLEDKQLSLVNWLLDRGANINARDEFGYTPLYFAIASNFIHLVELLLRRGAAINLPNKNLASPLLYAVCRAYLPTNKDVHLTNNCVELLLRHGADPNTQPKHDKNLSKTKDNSVYQELNLVMYAAHTTALHECLKINNSKVMLSLFLEAGANLLLLNFNSHPAWIFSFHPVIKTICRLVEYIQFEEANGKPENINTLIASRFCTILLYSEPNKFPEHLFDNDGNLIDDKKLVHLLVKEGLFDIQPSQEEAEQISKDKALIDLLMHYYSQVLRQNKLADLTLITYSILSDVNDDLSVLQKTSVSEACLEEANDQIQILESKQKKASWVIEILSNKTAEISFPWNKKETLYDNSNDLERVVTSLNALSEKLPRTQQLPFIFLSSQKEKTTPPSDPHPTPTLSS